MKNRLILKSLLQKLIGASFSISIFFIIMFLNIGFNLFEFHELITSSWVWAIFFGYGLVSSIIIDSIGKLIPKFTIGKQVLLYMSFGYLLFLYTASLTLVLIAGTIGMFFSLLFLLGKQMLQASKWYSWSAFIVPLIVISMIPFDFTSKQGWNEARGDQSVEISYDYFNGEHLIPISGAEGDKVYFEIEDQFSGGGSHGVSLYDEDSNPAGMNLENGDLRSVNFEEETTKYIVVRAIGGEDGQINVTWWEEERA